MAFLQVKMTVSDREPAPEGGYPSVTTVAEFTVSTDSLKALNVYQAALTALTSGDLRLAREHMEAPDGEPV